MIADLYVALFRSRFVDSVRCYDRFRIEALLSALPQMVSGNALLLGAMSPVKYRQHLGITT